MIHPMPIDANLHVLLVDDSLVNQKLLTGLLRGSGVCVTLANNGQQAVDAVAERDFDAVLMDVEMPVMDGLTATRLIRQREANGSKRTMIIGVTDGADRDTCLRAGMDCYLAKPVRGQLLRETLERVSNA